MKKVLLCLLLVLGQIDGFLCQGQDAESVVRNWTDTTGEFSTLARLDRVADGHVFLTDDTGNPLEVSLEMLSAEDQQFVAEYLLALQQSEAEAEAAAERKAEADSMVAAEEMKAEATDDLEAIGYSEGAQNLVPEEFYSLLMMLILLGILFLVVGNSLFLMGAFSESVIWGLACLFLPFVSFFFLVCHWKRAKAGFLCSSVGGVIVVLACLAVTLKVTPPAQESGQVDDVPNSELIEAD